MGDAARIGDGVYDGFHELSRDRRNDALTSAFLLLLGFVFCVEDALRGFLARRDSRNEPVFMKENPLRMEDWLFVRLREGCCFFIDTI